MVSTKFIVLAFLVVISFSYGETTKADTINEIVAIVQVHRHGQRTPVSFYPNDPYKDSTKWKIAPGQLTNEGKNQHYDLGEFTRDRYDGFLSKDFDPEEFYAQTTEMDRTHMSAQCNVAGIFPPHGDQVWKTVALIPFKWQPIPIRVSDPEVIIGSPDCAIFNPETANVLLNAEEFQDINEKYADLYAYLTEHTGMNVTSVLGVNSIYDTLLIEDQFGFDLADWTKSVYPSPMDVLAGYGFLSWSYTPEQKRLSAGRWLNVVADYFEAMFKDPTSDAKYQLYSAHDANIASILNTLGAFIPHAPYFASTLYFELRNKSGSPVINIWHRNNGDFESVTVEGCDFNCKLDDFRTVLSDYLVDAKQWELECHANSTALTDLTTVHSDPDVLKEIEDLIEHANNRRAKSNPITKLFDWFGHLFKH